MTQLLGPNGQPYNEFKKAPPPKLGPAFGNWAGRDVVYNQLPGGSIMTYNLNNLTLADFRAMREHPQINASLCVLTFMMHQLDWWIECDDSKIGDFIAEALHEVWTRLIRALSQAYWAGYSPTAIEWDNDTEGRRIIVSKFKDLFPEECTVHWKIVEGYAPPGRIPPKFKEYDGIKQAGTIDPIPPENSIWYPLLMENGNFYGKKLLKPAFAPWYFSQLIHLFANRYYERFGEPTPVGRAPFEDVITQQDGSTISGRDAMYGILGNLRNRGVVVLPNDRMPVGQNNSEWEYTVEYLESQMRGADFERYLSRLDEEMSLGIFTPVLLFRTADVGSYNLGVSHMQIFLWMLNALAGDMKEYIDRYVIDRLRTMNFGPNSAKAEWEFRKMGKDQTQIVQAILNELTRNNRIMPDLDELGMIAGLSLTEIQNVIPEPPGNQPEQPQQIDVAGPDKNAPAGGTPAPTPDTRTARSRPGVAGPRGVGQPRATARQISARIAQQVTNAFQKETFGKTFTPSLGYRRRFEESLKAEGHSDGSALELTDSFYTRMDRWLSDVVALGPKEFEGPDDFMALFDRLVETEIERLGA